MQYLMLCFGCLLTLCSELTCRGNETFISVFILIKVLLNVFFQINWFHAIVLSIWLMMFFSVWCTSRKFNMTFVRKFYIWIFPLLCSENSKPKVKFLNRCWLDHLNFLDQYLLMNDQDVSNCCMVCRISYFKVNNISSLYAQMVLNLGHQHDVSFNFIT